VRLNGIAILLQDMGALCSGRFYSSRALVSHFWQKAIAGTDVVVERALPG
jgi:hypothetical protein